MFNFFFFKNKLTLNSNLRNKLNIFSYKNSNVLNIVNNNISLYILKQSSLCLKKIDTNFFLTNTSTLYNYFKILLIYVLLLLILF